MDIFSFNDYVDILKAELELRSKKNLAYSMRAFARDLKMSHSRLSEIFRGQGFFSPDKVKNISISLKHSQIEKNYCFKLASLRWEKRKEKLSLLNQQLLKIRSQRKISIKDKSSFSLLDRWYYLPLMEYLTLGAKMPKDEIIKKMKLTKSEFENGIQMLERQGYLKKTATGAWVKSTPILKLETPIPSPAIQLYHRNYLRMAEGAITNQSIAHRKFLSSVISIKSSHLEEARIAVEEFVSEFSVRFASEDAGDKVLNFGLQLFESTERPK